MKISPKVARVLQVEQISLQDLKYTLDRAAITRLRGFNRRYFHWLFLLQVDALNDMQHAQMTEIGNGETKMMEEHEACGGQGCHECGWIGQVGRWVTDKQVPKHEALRLQRNHKENR